MAYNTHQMQQYTRHNSAVCKECLEQLKRTPRKDSAICTSCNQTLALDMFSRSEKKEAVRGHRARCRPCTASRDIMRRYGLTPEKFQLMWDEQHGKCYICDLEFKSTSDACVDHDHTKEKAGDKAGSVRRLLCHSCNVALGHVSEDPQIIIRLFLYVAEFKITCAPDVLAFIKRLVVVRKSESPV